MNPDNKHIFRLRLLSLWDLRLLFFSFLTSLSLLVICGRHPNPSRKSQLLIRIKSVDWKSVSNQFPRRKPAKQEICDRDQFTRNRKMKSIPKRSHSRTRFDYRPNGLSIYYQRSNDDVEEEMMRIRVVTDGKPIDDSLRSSVSSPPESSSWTTLGSTSSVSGTSDKTKKRTKNKHRKRKSKNKNKSSKHQKRMTSRPVILSKKWKTCLRRKKEPEGMDKKSLRILDDLKILNFKIREKFQIPMDCGHIMSDSGTIRNSIPSIPSDSSPSPTDFTRTAVERSHSMSPILTAEAFDYRGRPLKPSLAITPFPGARSVETRKKIREFLLGVGKDKEKKEEKSKKPQFAEFMKPPVPPVAHTPSDTDVTLPKTLEKEKKKEEAPPIKLTRVSSDTKFPGARSPATREKVRLLLKDCALKKRLKESVNEGPYDNAELTQSLKNIVKERDERKKKEEEEKKKKKKKEKVVKVKKTESTSSSLRTIYSKNAIGCNTCTSCTRCISFCTEQHTKKEKKTTEDSSKSGKAKKEKKKNKKKKKKETISKSSRSYSTSTASESIEISEKSKRKSKKKKSQFF
ncbi:hypothetical protein B9Z55_002535 [Caenorhabditis nigoni]|nr:hypothetical protein B9Z55_002535 [Caenorhabditis nigoni]